MEKAHSISKLPVKPVVYALYGGRDRRTYVAYVGIADSLRKRVKQHLVRRNSSVTTGTSAAGLNPDLVTEVSWWEHRDFDRKYVREAAEPIAFEVLNPALRSRGTISEKAEQLCDNQSFSEEMQQLFRGDPTGRRKFPTFLDILEQITEIEERVASLERAIGRKGSE